MHSSKSSRSAFRSPFGNPFRSPRTQKENKRHNYTKNGMRVIKEPIYRNGMRVQPRYRSQRRNELSEKNLFEPSLKELVESINKNLNQLRALAPKSANNINAIERELNEIKKNMGLEYEIFNTL